MTLTSVKVCSHLARGEQYAYTEQPEGRLCLDCSADLYNKTGRRSLESIWRHVTEARKQKAIQLRRRDG